MSKPEKTGIGIKSNDSKEWSHQTSTKKREKVSLPVKRGSYTMKDRIRLKEAYSLFDPLQPQWSNIQDECLAQVLKATKFFFCYLNPSPEAIELAEEICSRSIMEDGFNGKYAKVYKYCRQSILGINWTPPEDFPVQLLDYKINSWIDLKQHLRGLKPGTPEVLIPGELLFPWEDDLPSDIEYLEGESNPNKLDTSIIKEILDEIIGSPRMIPVMTDFVVSQTNCKRIHKASNFPDMEKMGKKAMGFKYKTVAEWVDGGCKYQKPIALRTPVWKRTTEYRDAISLNPCTLFQVWELNSYLKFMINHKGVGDFTTMEDLKKFYHQHSSFLLTDWKKSGLTIPHWFVKLVIEEVQKKAPTYNGQFPSDGIHIWDPEKKKWFINNDFGYGLGMINNVYTLFNICLFEYAKRKNIFTEKDKIISFNDDSVIGCKESSYNQWLGICQDSGGYVDVHKSVQSDCIQFCEMHQGKKFHNSFKWLSCFHTLTMSMLNSLNVTHWRFNVTQMWDAVRGYGAQLVPKRFSNEEVIGNIAELVLLGAANYWGCGPFKNGVHPEFGGVGIGFYFRTDYNLKDTLVNLGDSSGKEFFFKGSCLRVIKESEDSKTYPSYRPWEQFPEGVTKDYMSTLGSVHGMNHELKSLLDKTQNKFLLESNWFQEELWTKLDKQLSSIDYDNPVIFDIESYVASKPWNSYAIPRFLVEDQVPLDQSIRELPFVRMNKEQPKYSLVKMLEEFFLYFRFGKPKDLTVDDLDLRKYLQWEAPVYPDSGAYNPICDMETISKIADFNDPRRVFLDYWSREHCVITKLRTEERRAKSAALFLSLCTGLKSLKEGYATWYTKFPMPYDDELKEILSHQLPILHDEIIYNWLTSREVGYEPLDKISFETIEEHKQYNKEFWRKKTKTKSRQEKKARPSKTDKDNIMPEGHTDIMSLNMDDTSELISSFITRVNNPSTEEETIEVYQTPLGIELELADLRSEKPDWMVEAGDSSDYDSEYYSDDDEDAMVRAALDALESGQSWEDQLTSDM